MSLLSTMLIPLMLSSDSWDYRPQRRFYDLDSFGFGISPRELQLLDELRRFRISPRIRSELEQSTIGKDGFQALIDVRQFKPNEITVKTVDNTVVVEGKHEEREDDQGFISRHFIRKFTLPIGYDPKEVVSTLSSDGVLTVKAPPPKEALENERIVQIQQTGPAHLNVKDNPVEEAEVGTEEPGN